MIIKDKNQNEENIANECEVIKCLKYIKIDSKNKIEKLNDDIQNQILMEFVNSINVDKEDNLGQELNKFFIQILPENKDRDVLKVNYALSKKIKENSGGKNKQLIAQHEEYMTQIMNSNISQNFILTSEINEKLSIILSIIFKKIKKTNKITKNEELEKYISEISNNSTGILEKYKDKNKMSASSYIYVENPSNIYNDYNDSPKDYNKNIFSINNSNSNSNSKISINNNSEFNKSVYLDYNIKNTYVFKELKTKKPLFIPLEVLILREKFEKIKKLKLILKKNCNENLFLNEKDIINNIFVLMNLNWLFPNLIQIELDLTNENILKDEISSNNDKFEKFLKKVKKNKKTTNYQSEYKKRIYDLNKKSIFNEQNQNHLLDEFELLSESPSMISSSKDTKDEEIKKREHFMKKYTSSLEMVIIYWYFLSKLKNVKTCSFTIPMNLEDKILLMLKEKKIFLFDFNLFANLSSDNILDVTLDFNSLDNKLFQQSLNFLIKNGKMKNCRLSFFPSEEYFEPQFLLKLLLNSDNNKGINYINYIKPNEEIEIFILKKLSEYFKNNMNRFFSFFINKKTIKELFLNFDMPNILNIVDCYELIIIKLIINMFIYLDKENFKSNYNDLNTFSIIAENLSFDNRKHPFLNFYFENMNIYRKEDILLSKFTLKLKMIGITNIYKIIPFQLNYLSIGSFDLETFKYFVEYITSIEYNRRSKIISLQITLGNSILFIKDCFSLLMRLLVEHPKNLEQICIYTNLITDYFHIKKLLQNINYNKIEKIFIQFSKKSLEDENLKKKYGNIQEQLKDYRDNNFMDLFFVKRNEKNKEKILKMMYKLGNRYNKNFMDINIYIEIEKFISSKEKKQFIIQYK